MKQRKIFEKTALTTELQLGLLQKRNLNIENEALAKSVLSSVSYYRLSAYFKPFDQLHIDLEI